jgi:hypothetical protein
VVYHAVHTRTTHHDPFTSILNFHIHATKLYTLLLCSSPHRSQSFIHQRRNNIRSRPFISPTPKFLNSPRTAFSTILNNSQDSFNTFLLRYCIRIQTPFLPGLISFSLELTDETHSNAPSETNGRKNGSVSEAVFADFAMTSL